MVIIEVGESPQRIAFSPSDVNYVVEREGLSDCVIHFKNGKVILAHMSYDEVWHRLSVAAVMNDV